MFCSFFLQFRAKMPGMHGIRLGRTADCRKKLGENKTAPVPLQKQYGCRKSNCFSTASALYVESCHAGVNGAAAQLLLNAQQLVVLCNTLGTAGSTGLDLAGVQRHGQIGNGGVLGLAGAVRADGGVTGLVGHLDGLQRLGNRTDLVQLDQDGVAGTQLDALGQTLGVGDEQVIAHQLDLAAQLAGHLLPALPVLFVQTILNGDDGVLLHQALPVGDQLAGGELGAGLGQLVEALALGALPLGGSSVHGQHEVLAGHIAGLLNGGQNGLDGLLITGQVGGKAALIAHRGGQTLGLQDGSQGMEHLGTPAQGLLEGGSAHRHDHELLDFVFPVLPGFFQVPLAIVK